MSDCTLSSNDALVLKSRDGGASLKLSAPSRDTYQARISAQRLRAQITVSHIGGDWLGKFFEDLAHEWRGWSGAKSWRSLEDDLNITATHDRSGHIRLRVTVRGGRLGTWWAQSDLILEAGQLDGVARAVASFCSQLGAVAS